MNTGHITYQAPGVDDAAAIAELQVRSMIEAYEAILPPDVLRNLSIPEMTRRWRGFIADAQHPILLARVNDEAAGIVRTGACTEQLQPKPDGHIFQLYVLRAFHRRGIGRGLISSASAAWQARGASALSVGVLTDNLAARSFYEKMGGRLALQTSFDWDGYEIAESVYVFENLKGLSSLV